MNQLRKTKTLSLKADAIQENRIVGDASACGNLDSYRDVIFPDPFPGTVLSEFLALGFVADTHDWSKMVAMPLVAEMRGNVLHTEAEFHSTPDAQIIRTKCAERIANNLAVGLSIGFMMEASDYIKFSNGAALLKYAESKGYDLSRFDVAGITACKSPCQAILKISKLVEYSVVAAPANPAAWATSVKGRIQMTGRAEKPIWLKSEYLGEYAEASACFDALYSLTSNLMWNVVYECCFGDYYMEGMTTDERLAYMESAYAEYTALSIAVARALLGLVAVAEAQESAEGEPDADDLMQMSESVQKSLTLFYPNLAAKELPAGTLAQNADATLAVVKAMADRFRSIHQLKLKEGRQISGTNRERLQTIHDGMATCKDDLATLLEETAPTTTDEAKSTLPLSLLAAHLAARNAEARAMLVAA